MEEEQSGEAQDVTEGDAQEETSTVQEEAELQLVEGGEEADVDELATLHQELDKARAKEAEYLDGWQRARAELSNARKRFQREQEQTYGNAKADVLARLLPILDDFERAFETLPNNLSSLTWFEGVQLIYHKFQVLLEQEGVTPIEVIDHEFDPFLHQAVTLEPSETVPEGHVIAELQKGYKMNDRVLRPSAVRVSSGLPPAPESEAEVEPESEVEVEPAEEAVPQGEGHS